MRDRVYPPQYPPIGARVTVAYRSKADTAHDGAVVGTVIADRSPDYALGLDTDSGPWRIPWPNVVKVVLWPGGHR
jgi:hypothetical protein